MMSELAREVETIWISRTMWRNLNMMRVNPGKVLYWRMQNTFYLGYREVGLGELRPDSLARTIRSMEHTRG
jgi:hypothetical protein